MIVIASLDNSTVTTDDAFIVNGLKKQLLDICDRVSEPVCYSDCEHSQ